MDPVTHLLVGAVVGRAVAGRKLGFTQAACWGAVAAELPDIDVLVSAGSIIAAVGPSIIAGIKAKWFTKAGA